MTTQDLRRIANRLEAYARVLKAVDGHTHGATVAIDETRKLARQCRAMATTIEKGGAGA